VRKLREAVLRNSLTTLGVLSASPPGGHDFARVGLQTPGLERLTRSGLFDAVFVTSQPPISVDRAASSSELRKKGIAPLGPNDARQQFSKLST